MLRLEGIIPPIPTPFTANGDVEEGLLKDLIKWYLDVGVHGIAICGSTGEGYALLPDEYLRICEVSVSSTKGRVPVIAGVIVNSLKQALTYGRIAKDVGVDALMVTPPYYIFTPSEEGLYQYFRKLGEDLEIPILIYNVIPHVPVPINTIVRLVNETKYVIGVKQSRGDIGGLADLVRAIGDKAVIMSAIDDLLYPSFILGAKGAIAAVCTVAPDLCLELYESFKRRDLDKALDIHNKLLPIWRIVGQYDMPARVKVALRLRGLYVGYPRSPLLPTSNVVENEIMKTLKEVGIIK